MPTKNEQGTIVCYIPLQTVNLNLNFKVRIHIAFCLQRYTDDEDIILLDICVKVVGI